MKELLPLTQALADATRLRILELLCGGEATVNDLAAQLALPQPRISSHLALLRRAGLVTVQTQGRQHTYQVDRPRLQSLFAALQAFLPHTPPPRSQQAAREVYRNSALRQGRSCYDHLAGVVGVQLLDALLQRDWLHVHQSGAQLQYTLTPHGEQALHARGVAITQAATTRRRFAYACLDWTERRVHLGGALGAAILAALLHAGIVERQPGTRTLHMRSSLASWLDETPAMVAG